MDYKILEIKYNSLCYNLRIIFNPDNAVLNTFFSALHIKRLPELLNNFSRSDGYYQERMSARYYSELDWEDLEELKKVGNIKKGQMVIYHEVEGELIIDDFLFENIMCDYAVKHYEIYYDDVNLSQDWSNQVEEGINALKQKIKSKK
jgi:hypothetical protein